MSIGERLKRARKATGLSLRAVAEKVGVSAQAVSKYERGLDMPGSSVLLRLAQTLGVKVEYFFRTSTVDLTASAYRKRCTMGRKQEGVVQEQVREWIERYLEVEDILSTETMLSPRGLIGHYPVASLDDVEHAAQDLRQKWGLGTAPIENLMELMEDHGIKVGLVDAADDFDACTFWVNGEIPIIAVKRGVPGDRQRFNLAHELAHIVLEPVAGLDPEKAAHRFAGAFLVPAAVVRQELGSLRHSLGLQELHILKHKYGLSMQGWVYRAKDLGIVSEAVAARIFRRFKQRGWHRLEPDDPFPPEEPRRMERLILRALAEDLISVARAAELVGRPVTHLVEEVEYVGTPADVRC